MNFGQLKNEVAIRVNGLGHVQWTEVDIGISINEGYDEISDASEWNELNKLFPQTTETYYNLYSLCGDSFLGPRSFFNPQSNYWLDFADPRDLDERTYRRWETTIGEPQKVILRGLNWLGLFPKKSTATGDIQIWWVSLPRPMVTSTDIPGCPQEFHFGLVEYAIYDLLSQTGETSKALMHWQAYLDYQERLRKYVSDRIRLDRISQMGGG